MENNRLFELADELKALRDRKDALEAELKQVNMDIDNVDWHLSNLMGETETQNFTRAGTMFFLSTKTRASAKAGQKDELFGALRANGYGDLITETINAGSLSSFVKEQIAENEDVLPGETILVWMPVSTSNSVLAVPAPKLLTTIWPDLARPEAASTWKPCVGFSSSE